MSIPRGPTAVRNSDYCLLCGFSVSTKSINGQPEGEVCHQCSHVPVGLWRLPTLLSEMGVTDTQINVIVRDIVQRCNLNFDPEGEVVSVWGMKDDVVKLPRTVHALREARLNTNVKWVYAKALRLNFEKNKVFVLSKQQSAAYPHRCIARLGRCKQSDSIDSLESLFASGFDSCEIENNFLVPTRDQIIFISSKPQKSNKLGVVIALAILYFCIISMGYLVNLDMKFL